MNVSQIWMVRTSSSDMDTKDNIRLMILTPQETLFEGLVEKVELPGEKGRFMVLNNHAPLISSLSEGRIAYTSVGVESEISISEGFVRVNENEIVACVEV